MDEFRLPGPEGPTHDHADDAASRHSTRKKPHIATEDECLAALSALPGLLMMRLIRPGEANAITRTFQTILSHRRGQHTGGDPSIETAELAKILRTHPKLAGLFAPLLSPEQIDTLLRFGVEMDT